MSNIGERNTGHYNTGHYNTGDWNTGHSNKGDHNAGDLNTGHRNTGQRNTGDWNTGSRNTGDLNTGDHNTGYSNTGRHNTGDHNAGVCNAGDWNTGRWNTGDWNTGVYNTGHYNAGDLNTGNRNTGDWNAGDFHAGCFNTVDAEKAYYFNKLLPVKAWENAYKPAWLYGPIPTTWVNTEDMTDEERAANPGYETMGGYFRKNDMAVEWRKAYASASPEDIQAVRDLPGFDYGVFEEITGLDLREKPMSATCEGKEVEIDGVTYVLRLKGES